MRKCENYMFCKPAGITLQGQFQLRIISDTGNIDVNVSNHTVYGGKMCSQNKPQGSENSRIRRQIH